MESKVLARLKEMAEEMPDTIDHIKDVVDEKDLVVEVLMASEHHEKFEKLISDLNDQIDNDAEQMNTLDKRYTELHNFIKEIENDEAKLELIEKFASVLGLA